MQLLIILGVQPCAFPVDPEADYQLIQAGRKRLAKHFAMLKAKLASIEKEDAQATGMPLERDGSLFPGAGAPL